MLTEQEEEGEREFWEQQRWELRHGKDYFRTDVVTVNGIEIEYHMAGDRCTYRCEKKTGKMVK